MKKFSKSTSIVLTIVLGILLIAGFIFSYVPMSFKTKDYISLSGSLNITSDISGGMYGEYNITTKNPTKQDIVDSMQIIKDVFEENGFKNSNVYAVGKSKIRVEVGAPKKGNENYASVYTQLASVTAGAFSLRSTYSLEETSIVLSGAKHVDEVKIFTNNDTKNISIIFNEEGQAKYEELCNNATSFYLALGDYSQQISAESVYDYTQLTLSNTDYENLIQLEQKIKLGCIKVELDAATAVINTMSASLSYGESASSSSVESYKTSTVYVVAFSAVLAVLVIGLCIMAIRFAFFAVLMLVSLLFSSYFFVGIMCIVPSIEIGLSGIASMIIGISIIFTYAYNFASKVKAEYNLGKSLSASLESSYKKQLPNILMSNIMLFLSALIVFALSFSELTSAAIIFATCIALSLFVNLLMIPVLVKMCLAIPRFGRIVFGLAKRKGLADLDEETEEEEA
ncbi:MAG: hypothetical protein J6J33_03280 [Clostridia bacterium]|nr:hypothetical protein [Clostridia bacterium]